MVQIGNPVKYDNFGRITCPSLLASLIHLEKGKDELTWHIEDGQIIIRKVTKLYNGQFDFESKDIQDTLVHFEEKSIAKIPDQNLSPEEIERKAYAAYLEDQKKKRK